MSQSPSTGQEIAIVGMAGRFPGAESLAQLWDNLRRGVESIEHLPAGPNDPPNLVRARAELPDQDHFDAGLFDYTPREAEHIDPAQRLLLECAHQTLEDAAYDPGTFDGVIGAFVGTGSSDYLTRILMEAGRTNAALDAMEVWLGMDRDYAATRLAYKLGLTGPAVTVLTACSTALVAVHLGCQALLSGECDLVLAGASAISGYGAPGYLHQAGSILSPDGHCRAFDAAAAGTLFGSGVGLVALRRLADAVASGDRIHAVIKGSATNNDAGKKVGFTAPSVDGQASVIREALAVAGVSAESVSYVEAHGTGTAVGDPIEVTALTQAYRRDTARTQYCALGSVKTNVGHLDAAAGIAGLIKVVLSLKHGQLPPSLHFTRPNPHIDFASSPFFVNAGLRPWEGERPRRAGVSSFGLGGTNAHLVVEEAPAPVTAPEERAGGPQLLVLSARTRSALDRSTIALAEHLEKHPDLSMAAVASTLAQGRRPLPSRRAVVASDAREAARQLRAPLPAAEVSGHAPASVVLCFPGGGGAHAAMGRQLYAWHPAFREELDRCLAFLERSREIPYRRVLFPDEGGAAGAALEDVRTATPLLFAVEYATARLLQRLGIEPAAMIGHSLGEYAAACLSGVLQVEDALAVLVARAELLASLPPGAMLSVPLPRSAVEPRCEGSLCVGASNGPGACTVSGAAADVDRLAAQLAGEGIQAQRLPVPVAFHSGQVEPILSRFEAEVRKVRLAPPRIPYLSNLTGTWMTAADATDPGYFPRQLRGEVRFQQGIDELLKAPHRLFVQVGPGGLLPFVRACASARELSPPVFSASRHPREEADEVAVLLRAVGALWMAGSGVSWRELQRGPRRCVDLPTYPFERRRYWLPLAGPPAQPLRAVQGGQPPAGAREEARPEVAPPPVSSPQPRPQLLTEYAPPTTPIESRLVKTMEELLGISPIGIHDAFFDLGGDSLIAGRLMARLSEHFLLELNPGLIFEQPTIAALAARLTSMILDKVEGLSDEEAQALLEKLDV